MKLILSTGSVKKHDPLRSFQIAGQAGADGVEIILQHKKAALDTKEIHRLKQDYGLEVSFVHTPFFQPQLLQYRINPQKTAENILNRSFDAALKIGAWGVVVHPFPAFFRVERIRGLMATLLNRQKNHRLIIAIENMEKRRFGPVSLAPYCLRSADELNSFACLHDCYITLDIAHCASCGIDPKKFYQNFHKRIVNIHLSDYDAYQCHYPVGTRTIDFKGLFACLKEYDYKGCICLETDPRYESRIFEGMKRIRGWLD